jgi:hypothetical protein
MLDLNSQPGKGHLFGIELAGLDKEIKRDRLVSFALWGAAPFLVLNFFYHTLTTIMITQAYLLTSWQFGYIFIVEEFENTKKPWFWRAMAPHFAPSCGFGDYFLLGQSKPGRCRQGSGSDVRLMGGSTA